MVEEKKNVFWVVQVTLVVVLNLDIVGVVESTGDESERLGLGVGHDSEDAGVFQMREMNFVHHFLLLHYPLHNLNLEQSYGGEGLVGDKDDDDDDLFWEDPDSDPCSPYLLPAFNRTTLLNQWFCFFFSHSNCNCHQSETQNLLPLNFPISIVTTKPKNALSVLSLTHSSICLCLSLSLYHFLPFLQVE